MLRKKSDNMKINLYDFDKTIYDGDSSTDFFFYSLMRYPKIIIIIPKILVAGIGCFLHIISKTKMKETIFSFLKYIPDIDSHIDSFWDEHRCYLKKFYMKKKHNKDIIISASPEFLLEPLKEELGVLDLMASRVDKKTGKFKGANCHGAEKVKRLNEKYTDYEVMESYSDNKCDAPILRLAKKQYIVKGEQLTLSDFK